MFVLTVIFSALTMTTRRGSTQGRRKNNPKKLEREREILKRLTDNYEYYTIIAA